MKKVLLIALLFLFYNVCFSQEPITFEKVVKVDSLNKNDIISKIKEHFTIKYKNNRFFKSEDRETGILLTKINVPFYKKGFAYTCYCGYIEYKMTVQVRDGRFKIVLGDFCHKPNGMCDLGLITTGDYKYGTINGKKYDMPVWIELQFIANKTGEEMISEFEHINFKSDNW